MLRAQRCIKLLRRQQEKPKKKLTPYVSNTALQEGD